MKSTDIKEIFLALSGNDFQERWNATQSIARSKYDEPGMDFGQSWKSASGRAFEDINKDFIVKNIIRLTSDVKSVKTLLFKELSHQKLELQARLEHSCTSGYYHLDNEPEIVCLKAGKPVLLIKIRTSLRDRVHMDLFWSRLYKERGVRYVMVTADDGLRTCERPTRTRTVAECIYDRIYTVQSGGYCDAVQPLSKMDDDIKDWLC